MSVRVGPRGPKGSSAPRANVWCVGRKPDGSPCCDGVDQMGGPLPFDLPFDVKGTNASGRHNYVKRFSHPRQDCCVVRALVAGGWEKNFRCKWWRDTPMDADAARRIIDADPRTEAILRVVGREPRPQQLGAATDHNYRHQLQQMQMHQHQQMQALRALQTYNALRYSGTHYSNFHGLEGPRTY